MGLQRECDSKQLWKSVEEASGFCSRNWQVTSLDGNGFSFFVVKNGGEGKNPEP